MHNIYISNKSIGYILIAAVISFFFGIGSLKAGDPIFRGFKFPISEVDFGDDRDVEVDVENGNKTYEVTGLKYQVCWYSLPENKFIYLVDREGENLKPEKKTTINFGKMDWSKFSVGARYRADFILKCDFDEFPDNSNGSLEFGVKGTSLISRDTAANIMKTYLTNDIQRAFDSLVNATLHIPQTVLPAGTVLGFSNDPNDIHYTF